MQTVECRIPNIDPHLHLGGCFSPEFIWNIIKNNHLYYIAESYEDVNAQMTFTTNEPKSFHRFLDKFKILDQIKWTEQIIDESIKSVCDYLETHQIDFAWMDFSINKYMNIGWHKHEAIKFIYDSFNKHRPGKVGLILSIKYESTKASQRQYGKLIEHPDVVDKLIGLDFVGDETYFDHKFYGPIIRDWKTAGKMTRVHVGESQSSQNIIDSLLHLDITNIAHGFKIIDSEDTIQKAKDLDISFDLSITSNYVTGVIQDNNNHPITLMHYKGLNVTLGSDDPVPCNTTLHNEFTHARRLGMNEADINAIKLNAYNNTKKYVRI